jgi:hypothetical protein
MKPFNPSIRRFYQVLSLVMALHFFNMSIDSPDRDPNSIPEDLSFNDIESITEFFAEVVLGWQDAFSEHDEADSEDGGSVDSYKYFFSGQLFATTLGPVTPGTQVKLPMRNAIQIDSVSREINSPPPRG